MSGEARIVGLDVWRALLLLGGPITHAALMLEAVDTQHHQIWSSIQWSTHLFRMQAFFFISGVVSSMSQKKHADWLFVRTLQLGLPLVTFWIVVMLPITMTLNAYGASKVSIFSPQHLWFLITLLIVSSGCTLFESTLKFISKAIDKKSIVNSLVVWIIVQAAFSFMGYYLGHYLESKAFNYLVTNTLWYGSFYVFGYCIGSSKLRKMTCNGSRLCAAGILSWIIAIALYLASFHLYFGDGALSTIAKYSILEIVVGITAVLVCLGISQSSMKISVTPNYIAKLSKTSFSIYLFHLPILQIVFSFPVKNYLEPSVLFFSTAIFSLTASIFLHCVLNKYGWYRAFFNGKISREKLQSVRLTVHRVYGKSSFA